MGIRRAVLLNGSFILISLVLSVPIAKAQDVTPRITQPVDESKLTDLKGSVRAEANGQNDRGRVPDEFRMEHMFLQLRRSPEQEQELNQFIDQLHDPKSPNFHHWLTAQEFGQRYGLAPQDLTTITGWLQSHGFAANVVYPNRVLVDFSGTAGQVRQAFRTEIHYLDVAGERHIANMSDPQVPAALGTAVIGITSLNDFKPHPNLTSAGTCGLSGTCFSVVPADLATIYNFNPVFAKGISGQGQTIVVLEPTNVFSTADWTTFRSTFGLSSFTSGSFAQIHPSSSGVNNCIDPGVVAGFEAEAISDAEWASAAAPSAVIELASCAEATLPGATIPTSGPLIALENLINASTQPPAIMSISYGFCEAQNTSPSNAAYNSAYQQAVSEGVSVFVAAGDAAAANCDQTLPVAIHGIGVNGFASTQYNVAVGGTDFGDTFAGMNSTSWNSTNTSNSGSALSYIPEIPWNNSCASVLIATFVSGTGLTYGTSGFCNSIIGESNLYLNTEGGSGGPSGCATGAPLSGTCAGYPKPSWQSVLGNPSDGLRDLPDVSLFAGDGVWGHAYVTCFSDTSNSGSPCTGGAPASWSRFGGTSIATPIVAGIQALVNQLTSNRWGNPNPTYYSLASAEYGAGGNANCNSSLGRNAASTCIFYDVTEGDMDVPCLPNSGMLVNCYRPSGIVGVLSTSDSSYQPAFGTHAGWDFATGLGSINVANLVNNWTSNTAGTEFSLSSTPASLNIAAAGQSNSSAITVTGTNGFTGSVTLTCTVSPLPINDPTTCVIIPLSVALSATTTSAAVTLKVSTTAGLASAFPRPENETNLPGYFAAATGIVMACIFLLGVPKQRRRWPVLLGLIVLVTLGVTLSGCGGGGGSSRINLGTPSGGYTVTVAASSGGTTQMTNVAVTVE